MKSNNAMQQYRKNHIQGGVESASPHRLIQMLMEGALEKIATAKQYIAMGEIAKKGEQISWAISIVDSLRACLNMEVGGEIAENLLALYNYMERCLLEANINSDTKKLDEVTDLLTEIKLGWDAIPTEFHHKNNDSDSQK